MANDNRMVQSICKIKKATSFGGGFVARTGIEPVLQE